MGHWSIELLGQQEDLDGLAATLKEPPARVSRLGDQFFLESERFDGAADASEVLRQARTLVDTINGLAKLDSIITQSVHAGAVQLREQSGEPPQQFIFVEGAITLPTVRMHAIGMVSRPDGTIVEPDAADKQTRRLKAAAAYPDVAKALRLFGNGDRDFSELYKVLEVIRMAESARSGIKGWAALPAAGWVTNSEMERFKRTAQHPGVLGDKARHGYMSGPPPSNPMTIGEARTFIKMLLDRWLSSLS